jgi:hypothetical protein
VAAFGTVFVKLAPSGQFSLTVKNSYTEFDGLTNDLVSDSWSQTDGHMCCGRATSFYVVKNACYLQQEFFYLLRKKKGYVTNGLAGLLGVCGNK